jgi:4-amino-4-deoxy-L-arabinose transferase-like glycosyltransferase
MLVKILKHKILILILLLAAVLRFYGIEHTPPALNWDEASHGYNAYSVLQTGKDEWGERLPTIFRAYGDYKLPVYIYITSLSIWFLGLTEIAIRTPSALAGVLITLYTYLLACELFKSKKSQLLQSKSYRQFALIAALLVAVEPWTLFLSRGAFEANLSQAFIVAGAYYFLKGVYTSSYFPLSMLLFGLSVWTYNSARIFVPLLLVALVYLYRNEITKLYKNNKTRIFYSIAIIFIFLLPMFYQLVNVSGQARYGKVAIIDEGAIASIEETRAIKNYHPFIERALYNKGTFFIKTATKNWLLHFSPNFLFFEGGDQHQYSLPGHGLLYIVSLPFTIIGLFVIFGKIKIGKKGAIFILVWLLIAPIPASITRDSPHALRAITFLPIPMIISALGLLKINEILKGKLSTNNRKILKYLYILILFVSLGIYLNSYFTKYREEYSNVWQYGNKEAVNFVKSNYNNYDKIIITKKYGEPHIFTLVYWPWEPENYRDDPYLIRFNQSDWYWVDRFDKLYFVNDWDIPIRSDLNFALESGLGFDCDFDDCLLITSPGNHPPDWKLLKTIYFLDGLEAFEIYDNK